MKYRLFQAAKVFLGLFVIVVLIINLTLIINHRFRNDAYPNFLGWRAFSVATGSMQPAIMPGDLVLVRKPKQLQVGDIISFMEGDSVVTHRIIGLAPSGFITQGDMNNTPDLNPVLEQNVLGTVRFAIPSGGIWLIAISRIAPIIALIILILLFYDHLVRTGRIKPFVGIALYRFLRRHLNDTELYAPTARAADLASNILHRPVKISRRKSSPPFERLRERKLKHGTEVRLKLPNGNTLELATWLTDTAAADDIANAATIAFTNGATANEIIEAVADFATPIRSAKKAKRS